MVTPQAGAVINGIAQIPMYSWAGKVYQTEGLQISECSGELIAPQWVLTAAHCFDDASGSATAKAVQVVLPSGTFSADAVVSTKWEVSTPGGGALEPDLSMIHLTTAPRGATPLPIATLQQENSFRTKGVTFFGFGHNTYLTATQGKTQNGVWTLNGNCPADLATWNVDCFTHHSTTLGQVVKGDSGGAWVGWADGHWVMLAAETGWNTETGDVTQYGTSAVRWSNWIANVEANDAPGGGGSGGSGGTPSISVGWGSNQAPAGNWMDITFTNFPTGPVAWYCVEEGVRYGPYGTTLTSSTETLSSNTCYDTESGGSDYVTADGINSNTIPADAPVPKPQPQTYPEATGDGPVHTWSNPNGPSGSEGPTLAANTVYQAVCVTTGTAEGPGHDAYWYLISGTSDYGSADAFCDEGATTCPGGFAGTPYVDPSVPHC